MGAELRVIHCFEIPVDDQFHGIDLSGSILHAAVRRPGVVDVWAYARPDGEQPMRRSFLIVGTGQAHPIATFHAATAITADDKLVWHVLENACPHDNVIEAPEIQDPPNRVPGICRHCDLHLIGNGEGDWIPA
ncbi:hypothetical protein ACFRCX_30610 [Streptomyces sp. NPDC056652]|uniref:DUF7352 domain-containing protein n=1 Tax=Streptomyces sp. NPDC056652 TaxID=3345893 RepID=UPI0036BD6CE8